MFTIPGSTFQIHVYSKPSQLKSSSSQDHCVSEVTVMAFSTGSVLYMGILLELFIIDSHGLEFV